MRILPWLTAFLLLTLAAPAQTSPSACQVGDAQCVPGARPPTKQELRHGHKEFERAEKLIKEGKLQEAADALDKALSFAPTVAEYISAREMLRQQMVTNHIEAGNEFLRANNTIAATSEFSRAVALDPHNEYALQRLQDALPSQYVDSTSLEPLSPSLSVVLQSKPVIPAPQPGVRDFHLKGSSRNVLEQIATAFGIKLLFDDSVNTKNIRFDMDAVDFFTAFGEACKLAHVFWVPLTPKQLILFNDTQQLRREYERTVSATFYLGESSATQEITETVNMLRALFDIRFAVAQPANESVVVRAPSAIVEAAGKVIANFLTRKPQVTIDVKVYQVSHSLTRQFGISLPLQFQAINVTPALIAALTGGSDTQSLINQLIASGGINSANSQALQSLLAQLQNQNNSLLNTGYFTFGGGKTLTAVTVPPATAKFQMNQSDLRSIQTVTLRAGQGSPAMLKIGSRYPILNASFAPIYNTPAITHVIQNGSYVAPIPSFTYEDIGINLKATPQVLADSSINLKLEMQMRALTGQSLNGVPVISNREYSASLCVPNGSTTAIVGMITQSEQKSLSGLPGFSHIPGLGSLTSTRTKDEQEDELLIVVTPTIVSPARPRSDQTEVWIPAT